MFGKESYDAQKKRAQTGGISDRLTLASSTKTHPEILYYLAEHDEDPAVRRAVVHNMATPIQASSVLVRDPETDIRFALAERLVGLWPDIGEQAHSQIYAFAVQSLGVLALDEVLKIRVALSTSLKDFASAPPKVVAALARDVERQVSEPVLRYCVALPDEDLIDILKTHPEPWVAETIAGRSNVNSCVSGAIIEHKNKEAGLVLLDNEGADLSEPVLSHIVALAKKIPEWQHAVALRKELPPYLAKDLATFVKHSIRDVLVERSDFDRETIQDISKAFQRRMDMAECKEERASLDPNERICDAIAVRDKSFILETLAEATALPIEKIDEILSLKSPKSIVALCWKGNLSMRTALALQKDFLKLSAKELIYPRGGTDYSLSEEDIQWQLEFLGI